MRQSFMRWLAVAISCMGCAGVCGCQREAAVPPRGPEKGQRTNHARIMDALEAVLRHRDDKHEAILTFEASTRKAPPFVQFVGSSRTGLQLIFPLPKDKAEAQRTEAFFKELGMQVEENDAYEDPFGEPTRRDRTFRKNFGKDVEPAARITEQIFERVYQLPADFPLRVID